MLVLFPNNQQNIVYKNIRLQQAVIPPGPAILKPEYEWESPRINMYGSVFKTDQQYEMFYQCGNAVRIGYACSDDGLNWRRPMINATDFNAKTHDIILNEFADSISEGSYDGSYKVTNLVAGYHMPSIIYEPESDKPYKIFAFGEGGYRTLYSPNGKQFEEYPNNPVIEMLTFQNPQTQKYWCSDVSPCFCDEGRYYAMVKTYELDSDNRTRRCVGYAYSDDFCNWSEAKTIWVPGKEEDLIAQSRGFKWADYYGLCPFKYGDIYLGFLWLFEIEHEFPSGTHLGKIEVFLATSDDGQHWRRLSDKPFIPWDLNYGEQGGMVTTPSSPIFDHDDIKLYYTDSNYEHGFYEKHFEKEVKSPEWVVRCARLPKERLVGAHSDNGEISIQFLARDYQQIRLNVDCIAGEFQLCIYSGAELLESHTFSGIDKTDEIINLESLSNLHASQSMQLLLRLRNATIYAIEFR